MKAAEANLAETKQQAEAERAEMADGARAVRSGAHGAHSRERDAAASHCTKHSLSLFESIRRSRGVAVTEMKDGRCSVCQVRLRPQVAQIVRRNDSVNQCDSCSRILYYVPPPAAPESVADAAPATPPASGGHWPRGPPDAEAQAEARALAEPRRCHGVAPSGTRGLSPARRCTCRSPRDAGRDCQPFTIDV